jgi:hypothetical protein
MAAQRQPWIFFKWPRLKSLVRAREDFVVEVVFALLFFTSHNIMHRPAQSITLLARASQGRLACTTACARRIPTTVIDRNIAAPRRRGLTNGLIQHASVQPASASTRTTPTPAPEMGSSLDQLVPKALFETSSYLPESLARRVVEVILTQLRSGIDAASQKEVDELQQKADDEVLYLLKQASTSASSLHHFVTQMLRLSKDPRKTPIAFRLFGIAFGVDPLKLSDPTAQSSLGLDSSLASTPIAGKNAWGVNAAGYSWASMVLSGQSPPPAGIHLLKKGSTEYIAAIASQQSSAVRIYATLAMRGDAQGMLGMGRVLMAGTQRPKPMPGKSTADSEKEVQLMRDRTIALWTKAGQLGVADAWFELGLLYLGPTMGFPQDDAKARQYFEMGAKEGEKRWLERIGNVPR